MALGCSDVGLEASQGYQPSSLEASGGGPAESPRRGATAGSAADRSSQALPRQPERAAGAAALYIGHSRDGAILQKGLVGLRRALLGWYPVGLSVIGRHLGGGWTGPGWLLVPADDHRIKARQQGGDSPVEFLQVVDPRWTGLGTGLMASTIPCRRRLSGCLVWCAGYSRALSRRGLQSEVAAPLCQVESSGPLLNCSPSSSVDVGLGQRLPKPDSPAPVAEGFRAVFSLAEGTALHDHAAPYAGGSLPVLFGGRHWAASGSTFRPRGAPERLGPRPPFAGARPGARRRWSPARMGGRGGP
jgi:hypothetical protein